MKKVVLVRHAKSDWSVAGQPDIDRPLNQRGYMDAHKLGAHLRGKISGKILFISSPAIRAITTALIFARELNYQQEKILMNSKLYEAEAIVYENLILSLDDNVDTVFIFGHNPTISFVISQLSNTRESEVPTCSVSIIKIESDYWSGVIGKNTTLEMQLFPKLLAE